jgi:formate dehydrogenase major subunit
LVLASAKASNEDNYILQKFARVGLLTNSAGNCAGLCHSSTVAALSEVFGSGAMTNSILDLMAPERNKYEAIGRFRQV